ncbi:MAG: DUF4173 domain-containing protein, partial [Lachnospiraceae bacterium]|nr:DUF4173 domain-containing protein [Lachnospiraceae bacterium]
KSGITAKKLSVFLTVSLMALGIGTCTTTSYVLIFLNKLGIFFLFFYLMLHNLYNDKSWDLPKYLFSALNVSVMSIAFIFHPFIDLSDFLKEKRKAANKPEGKGKYVFFGILIALPLLFVIVLLLYSADAVFSDIFDRLFTLDFDFTHLFGIFTMFSFAFFASYSIMCRLSFRNLKEEMPDKRTGEPVMGITFTGLIALVYLVFCYIQIVYLFGGLGTLPSDYTYASYAREGFFQLVFVCLINLMLVLICMKRFRENKILKGILTFICACTYVMIASSTYRMLLYIQAYQLTFLRVFVLWALFVIFLLISGALVTVYRERFPFTGFCLISVTVLYIMFSFAHPDYWIAKYNLDHYRPGSSGEENGSQRDLPASYVDGNTDFYYLRNLSLDAAPVIFGKADEFGFGDNPKWWFTSYGASIVKASYDFQTEELNKLWVEEGLCLPKKMSPRKWNLSRWRAQNIYGEYYKSHDVYAGEIEYNIMNYASDF